MIESTVEATVNGEPMSIGFRIGMDGDPMWDAGWYWLAYGEGQTVYSRKAHYMLADTGGIDAPSGSVCGLNWMSFDTPCKSGCGGCDECRDVLCKRCRRIKERMNAS